jgi:hypothetical protein
MGEMDEGKQGKKRESRGGGFWLERNGGEGDVVTVSCRSNRRGLKTILTHASCMSGGRGKCFRNTGWAMSVGPEWAARSTSSFPFFSSFFLFFSDFLFLL